MCKECHDSGRFCKNYPNSFFSGAPGPDASLWQDRLMSSPSIAVLGAGNLGLALLSGLHAADPAANLFAADPSPERRESARAAASAVFDDNREAVERADLVILAVKPHLITTVLEGLRPSLRPEHWLVSVAAGVPLAALEAASSPGRAIVRAMPNIAMISHASATALCANGAADERRRQAALDVFRTVGEAVYVDESQMDAVTGLSGSGPAYVFLIAEALADGAVRAGLPPAAARRLAAQTLLGAAQMLLGSERHPAEWRSQVTTPGGTTIAGLYELERAGVRGALMAAVGAAAERSREMAKAYGEPR